MGSRLNIIKDESGDRKYFIHTPQIVWALARTPYDYILWDVIKMVAGESGVCKLGTRQLAELAKMSVAKVQDSREYLLAQGLIEGELKLDSGYSSEVWNLTIPDLWERTLNWRKTLDSEVPGHHIIAKVAWAASFAQETKNKGLLRSVKGMSTDVIKTVSVTAMNVVRAACEAAKISVHNANRGVHNTNTDPISVHNTNANGVFFGIQRSQYERIQEHVNRVFLSSNDSSIHVVNNHEPKIENESSSVPQGVKINFDLEPYKHDSLGRSWVWVNTEKVPNPTGKDLVKAYCINTTPKQLRIALPGKDDPTLFKPEHVFVENGLGMAALYPVAVSEGEEDRKLTPNQKGIKDALIDIMPLSGMESETDVKRFMSNVQGLALRADSLGHTPDNFRLFARYFYEVVWAWNPDAAQTKRITESIIKDNWKNYLKWLEAGGIFPGDDDSEQDTTEIESGQLPQVEVSEAQAAWLELAASLKGRMTAGQYNQHFGLAQPIELESGMLTVAIPRLAIDWVNGRLKNTVDSAIKSVNFDVIWQSWGE